MSVKEQVLSRNDLYRLLEFIEFCRVARQEDDVVTALNRLDAIIPFQASIVGALRVSGDVLEQTTRTFSLGFSPEYLSTYSKQEYAKLDPVFARGLNSPAPYSWAEAVASHTRPETSGKVRELLDLSEDYGLKRGIAYASRPTKQSKEASYICLETGRETISDAHSEALRFALPHLHDLVQRACSGDQGVAIPSLSVRELDVLNWLKEGKTAWEIGMILAVSERTVKFHITNCYTKLEVSNRAQAIARAMRLNLI